MLGSLPEMPNQADALWRFNRDLVKSTYQSAASPSGVSGRCIKMLVFLFFSFAFKIAIVDNLINIFFNSFQFKNFRIAKIGMRWDALVCPVADTGKAARARPL